MSTRPSCASVWSTSPRSSSIRRTLVGTAIARRPVANTAAVASASASGLRAAIATSAPCSASAIAIERPMPRLPPVTIATLPAREKSAIAIGDLRVRSARKSRRHFAELDLGLVPLAVALEFHLHLVAGLVVLEHFDQIDEARHRLALHARDHV